MSLPKALVHSTYRALAKHARAFDRSAAKRTLIAAAPTRFYVHEYEQWVEVERSADWDGARAAVDEFIRRANRGKEMYLPPLPNASDRSAHPLLDIIREAYRARPNTSAAFSEAFSAVRLFTSATERTQALPADLPYPAKSHGFVLSAVADKGTWEHADASTTSRIIVANPLLPGIFAHSIVCMIPPPPPDAAPAADAATTEKEDGAEAKTEDEDERSKTSSASTLQGGATGFIVNKPLLNDQGLPVPLWAAFPADSPRLFTETLANNVVMVGGPVGAVGNRETAVFVIHQIPDVPEAVPVAPGVWSSFRNLEALDERIRADAVKPADVLVVVGYAGWGQSQLGGEVENGSWFVADRTTTTTDDAAAVKKDVASMIFGSNITTPPDAEPSTGASTATPIPPVENPDRAWCELLAGWGGDHADLTRLMSIHRTKRPSSDTSTW